MTRKYRFLAACMAAVLLLNTCPAGLADFTCPAQLKQIEEEAFDGDTSMTGLVTLPAGMTSIGANAFRGSGLYALSVPASVSALPSLGLGGGQEIAYVYLEGAGTAVGNTSGAHYLFGPAGSAASRSSTLPL